MQKENNMRVFSLLLVLVALMNWTCSQEEDQSVIDRQAILDFLTINNLEAEEDPSGLFYIINEPGGEEKPLLTDSVTIEYQGYLTNGAVFDGTDEDMPVTFRLGDLIEGWKIGIPKFGREGNGVLLIPSALGYGSRRVGSIPPNSVLIFDIALDDF